MPTKCMHDYRNEECPWCTPAAAPSAPREWTLAYSAGLFNQGEPEEICLTDIPMQLKPGEIVHVVEKSALDAALAEVERLKKGYWDDSSRVLKERDALKEKCAQERKGYEDHFAQWHKQSLDDAWKILNRTGERDAWRTQAEALAGALERLGCCAARPVSREECSCTRCKALAAFEAWKKERG